MMKSSPLMEKTGASVKPTIPVEDLQQDLLIKPEKNTDLITVAWTESISKEHAVQTVNAYVENVVEMTKRLQAEEARDLLSSITAQVERTDTELTTVQKDLMAFSKESGLFSAEKETDSFLKQIGDMELKIETSRIEKEAVEYRLTQTQQELAKQNPGMQKLKDSQDLLAELLTKFTPAHPSVKEQQARVDSLKKAMETPAAESTGYQAAGNNNMANDLYLSILTLKAQKESLWNQISSLQTYRDQLKTKLNTIPDKSLAMARIKAHATALEETRSLLVGRQREAQLFSENAPSYYRLVAQATPDNVEVNSRIIELVIVALVGAVVAAGLVIALRALRSAMNDQVVSPSDVRRLTKMNIIAVLPPEETLDTAALARWRFSTWANLVKSVSASPQGAFVVGILSAEDGAGKSTWLRHLGRGALDRGLKVLAITHGNTGEEDSSVPILQGLSGPEKILTHLRKAQPAAVELNAPETWEWTAETRQKWSQALAIWSQEPNLVVLVELPAAENLESLLLAETLPAILWLTNSGTHRREEVTGILDTIRHSGVPLVGALLNRIPPIFLKLPDLGRFGLCLAASLLLSLGAHAQDTIEDEPASPPPAIHGDLPAIPLYPDPANPDSQPLPDSPAPVPEAPVPQSPVSDAPRPAIPIPVPHPNLAPWQQRLTLGPGDLVNLQVFGKKEYTRNGVPIGPDGTLSYLQVAGYKAGGQTIDELRKGLTREMGKYIQNVQVIVTPGAFRSKKYFLLGTVMDRGAYTLDRPITLLEATARAHGIATGVQDLNTVEIADMSRAFLIRDGKRMNVNFTKLFLEGDTSQNVALHPGDYIYFPSNTVKEVYVLGAVSSPGQTGISDKLTSLGAIIIRGGFAPSAWRSKVLVIRNGIGKEAKREVLEVDAAAILAGKGKDVFLQPRDLVYVSEKPWKSASELADTALRSFVQTAAATWIGGNDSPFLNEPILPSLKNP